MKKHTLFFNEPLKYFEKILKDNRFLIWCRELGTFTLKVLNAQGLTPEVSPPGS